MRLGIGGVENPKGKETWGQQARRTMSSPELGLRTRVSRVPEALSLRGVTMMMLEDPGREEEEEGIHGFVYRSAFVLSRHGDGFGTVYCLIHTLRKQQLRIRS